MLCAPILLHKDVLGFNWAIKWGFVNWSLRYPSLQSYFNAAFLSGEFYPRWIPELMAGRGYPTFVYYPPGAFFAALPASLLLGPVWGWKVTLPIALWLGSFGLYRFLRLFISPLFASITAVLFLYLPFTVITLYTRATYSELMGILLVPWCLYYLIKTARCTQASQPVFKPAIKLTACLTALCYMHPFVCIHFATFCLPYALLLCWQSPRRKALFGLFSCCAALALTLSAPYWFHVWLLKDDINSQGIFFVYKAWWQPAGNLITANLGFTLFALAGLLLNIRRGDCRLMLCIWAWFFYLQTDIGHTLWNNVPWMTITQLPYRIFSVENFIRLWGLAFFWKWLAQCFSNNPKQLYGCIVLTLIIIAAGVIYKPMAIPSEHQNTAFSEFWSQLRERNFAYHMKNNQNSYSHESHGNDFLPATANLARIEKEPVKLPLFFIYPHNRDFVTISDIKQSGNGFISATIKVLPDAFKKTDTVRIRVRQLYFPGWRIYINHPYQPTSISYYQDQVWQQRRTSDGYLLVDLLKPKTYHFYAEYDGPPGWPVRNSVMCIITFALLLLLTRISRGIASRNPRLTDDLATN